MQLACTFWMILCSENVSEGGQKAWAYEVLLGEPNSGIILGLLIGPGSRLALISHRGLLALGGAFCQLDYANPKRSVRQQNVRALTLIIFEKQVGSLHMSNPIRRTWCPPLGTWQSRTWLNMPAMDWPGIRGCNNVLATPLLSSWVQTMGLLQLSVKS